jgi:hypothetical protein
MPQQFSLPKPLLLHNLFKNFLFVKCLPLWCKSWGLLLSQLAIIRCLVFAFKSDASWPIYRWLQNTDHVQTVVSELQWPIVSWVLTIQTSNRNLTPIVTMKSCSLLRNFRECMVILDLNAPVRGTYQGKSQPPYCSALWSPAPQTITAVVMTWIVTSVSCPCNESCCTIVADEQMPLTLWWKRNAEIPAVIPQQVHMKTFCFVRSVQVQFLQRSAHQCSCCCCRTHQCSFLATI